MATEHLTNNVGAALLFGEAKACLELIQEVNEYYNEIVGTLESLGYGDDPNRIPTQKNPDWPDSIPSIWGISSGNSDITPEDMDYFWDKGPRKMKAIPIVKRGPLMQEKERLGKETGWTCHYCNRAGNERKGPDNRVWHVDHPYPVALGGDDQADNHVLSCATCNLDKKSRTAAQYFRKKLFEERQRAVEAQG